MTSHARSPGLTPTCCGHSTHCAPSGIGVAFRIIPWAPALSSGFEQLIDTSTIHPAGPTLRGGKKRLSPSRSSEMYLRLVGSVGRGVPCGAVAG